MVTPKLALILAFNLNAYNRTKTSIAPRTEKSQQACKGHGFQF
jgi:hypothetical protein